MKASPSSRHVGIIGMGAIARALIGLLPKEAGFSITALMRESSKARAPEAPDVRVVTSMAGLLAARPDLIVEAAGHAAVRAYVPDALAAGVPILIASVGALADAALLADLTRLAAVHRTRLIIPAGAVGGLDYLGAARQARGLAVRYTSRKPPAAWAKELMGLGIDAGTLTGEHVLFEGAADEAAVRYPQNLNVAATLALAGVGMRETRVRVVADPAASGNTHEIEIESALGIARMTFQNAPSPENPKTSLLTAYAIAKSVERFFADVVI